MALDVNEVISNSIIGLIGLLAARVGAYISKFIAKVNQANSDLNAAFCKIRRLEKALGIKEECDASQLIRANGAEAPNGNLPESSHCIDAMGNK